jgi:hypothetical protein
MKLEILSTDNLIDIAFKVGTHLAARGSRAVLTGGSCATLYAPKAYQSSDVDFIASFAWSRALADEAVAPLGFTRKGRIFVHPQTVVSLDFPDDQVLIGDEFIREVKTHTRGDLVLTSLTPTDCVRDRLLVFYTEQAPDLSALRAAVGVASLHPVELDLIRDWSLRQGYEKRYRDFESRLSS